jgi:hypothetical protein
MGRKKYTKTKTKRSKKILGIIKKNKPKQVTTEKMFQMGKFMTQNKKKLNIPYEETNNYNVILINEPEDEESFINLLKHNRFTKNEYFEDIITEPVAFYKFQQINSWKMIDEAIKKIIDINKIIPGINAIKISSTFDLVLELHSRTEQPEYIYTENGDYVKYVLSQLLTQNNTQNEKLIPYTMNLTKSIEQKYYFKYLQLELQRMLERILGASSTKYIAITGITFNVYRLKNTGARLVGFE